MEDIDGLKEYIKENINKETQVEMRLFDNKNNRVVYKKLTVKELMMLEVIGLDWHDLRRDK